ncbi:MAG: hypothetical protein WCQ64_15180, partial [Acidobacteriota bacterium]
MRESWIDGDGARLFVVEDGVGPAIVMLHGGMASHHAVLPMVLPPVVGGVALFFALGRRGLVGQWLDRWFDIRLPFTMAGVVIAV